MICLDHKHVLMIEPRSAATWDAPVIDEYTRKMAGALNVAIKGGAWRGIHVCICGAMSGNCDLYVNAPVVSDKRFTGVLSLMTNSLAVHYLALHRADVPAGELEKVLSLFGAPVDPTPEQFGRRRLQEERRR